MLSLLLTEESSKHLRVVQCTTNTFLITFFSYLILISHFVQTLLALKTCLQDIQPLKLFIFNCLNKQ